MSGAEMTTCPFKFCRIKVPYDVLDACEGLCPNCAVALYNEYLDNYKFPRNWFILDEDENSNTRCLYEFCRRRMKEVELNKSGLCNNCEFLLIYSCYTNPDLYFDPDQQKFELYSETSDTEHSESIEDTEILDDKDL